MTQSTEATPWTPTSDLAHLVWNAGFTYDPGQDIILSRMGATQRSFGFCWAYDIASPTLSMIIDAEPLYFTYGGKQWMIELWKGQYGLETGGEIGVYNRPADWWTPNNSGWFGCADNADRLAMSFILYKNGKEFLTRSSDAHWWLTGFRWGVFSELEEVTMTATITLKNAEMFKAFNGALSACGYTEAKNHIKYHNSTVTFTFAKPYTGQPIARSLDEKSVQASNKSLVASYNAAKLSAKPELKNNDPNAITEKACPQLFELIKKWLESWHGWGPGR